MLRIDPVIDPDNSPPSPFKRLSMIALGVRKTSIPSPSRVQAVKPGEICIESQGVFKSSYDYKLPSNSKSFVVPEDTVVYTDESKTCRICLSVENIQTMISPCSCIGSQKYVHEECLKEWLLNKKINDLDKCELCKNTLKMNFVVTSTFMPFHGIGTCKAWVPCVVSFVLLGVIIYLCVLAFTSSSDDILITVSAFILGFICISCCIKGIFSVFDQCFVRKIENWTINNL
jgi:RING-variant domain